MLRRLTIHRHPLLRAAPALAFAALLLPWRPALAQDAPPQAGEGGSSDELSGSPDELSKKERKRLRAEEKRRAKEEARRAKDDSGRKKNKERRKAEQRRRELEAKTAIEWYEEALDRYERGKYLAAREVLLPLEDSVRASDIQEEVKLLIADTYFYQGGALNLAEALARYRSFLTFFPSSDKAEYVQFQIGNSYFRQLGPADRDQSFTASTIAEYERFLQLHPDSQWAEEARSNMLEARALKARSEFRVAEFYWDWKDWDAAARRLEEVLANHPALPERERALFMAAQSHYLSGEIERGHAYAARLAEDHPGSEYLRRLDPDSAATKLARKAEERESKIEKDSARTNRRQAKREMRRTRDIRKSTGLPGPVPLEAEVVGVREMREGAEPDAGATQAQGLAPSAPSPSSAAANAAVEMQEVRRSRRDERRAEKERRRAEKERRRMERLEAEERRRAEKEAERQRRRDEKRRDERDEEEVENGDDGESGVDGENGVNGE